MHGDDNDLINQAWLQIEDKVTRNFAQGVTEILIDLGMDISSIIVAILYPIYTQQLIDQDKVLSLYGKNILDLLLSIPREVNTTSTLQKMLLAAVEDVRVVVIKLALHTCEMQQAELFTEQGRRELTQESKDIYIPLSNRLGIGQIKWELEDLSFRYLDLEMYQNIAKLLDEKRVNRAEYLQEVISTLSTALGEQNVIVELHGRVKHIYSIWKKMCKKMVNYDEIYDVQAVRILAKEVADCYTVLGVVHTLWSHIPKEFDDYIANPKGNGYQSLHTAVVGPEGKILEIQIRTKTMHRLAELGVAAHWKCKENTKIDENFAAKLATLRQLINWQKELDSLNSMSDDDFAAKYPLDNAEIIIQDVGVLICHLAKCCKPVFGREIIGYITVDEGVSIHRKDCLSILHIKEAKKNRLIQVAWGAEQATTNAVNIIIKAYQRQGLLRDITAVLVQELVDVKFINALPEKQEYLVDFKLRLGVSGVDMLARTLAKLHQINNVYDVYREECPGTV